MSPANFPLPQLDLSINLPETLEFHEQYNGQVPIYVLAAQDSSRGKPSPVITYGQLARACRRVPGLLGLSKEDMDERPVVAILAHTDTLIYHTILLGLILAGAVPFPISHRNTSEAVVHLLRASSCQKLILSSDTLPQLAAELIQDLRALDEEWPSRIYTPPSLFSLYPELAPTPSDHDESPIWTVESISKPDLSYTCIYLHSSGSTGLPKAIPIRHYELHKYMKYPSATIFRQQNPRIQMACIELPPFHGMSFIFQLCVPLFHGSSASILLPTALAPVDDAPVALDPESVIELIASTKANACLTIPAFLGAWARNGRHVDVLKSLVFVEYGGGALPSAIGQELHDKGVTLRLLYGGTEFGAAAMCSVRPGDEEDWEYMEVAEDARPHFVPQGDGTFELQFISPNEYPLSITNIPGVNGYATSDLVRPHPTKSYLWKLAGRIDDVIVHSSGEKTVPAPIEFNIQSSPYVSGVVVFGVGRMQPGALIELRQDNIGGIRDLSDIDALRDLVWPAVEAANRAAPAFSRIFKEMILLTSVDKPLPRTPKLTVMKKAEWALYAQEIEDLYSHAASKSDSTSAPETWTELHLLEWLLAEIHDLGYKNYVNATDDLFERGFDSLCAVILHQRIVRAIEGNSNLRKNILQGGASSNSVYKYPSAESLAKYLAALADDNRDLQASVVTRRLHEIEAIIAKYSFLGDQNHDVARSVESYKSRKLGVVLITGSTGGLGSHALTQLLQASDVEKIYTLNRPDSHSNVIDRHRGRFVDRGLDPALLKSERLVHLESDAAQPRLGLSEELYGEIQSSVDLIIHIAWRMDFNLPLSSFESNVRATHNLAALARGSTRAQTSSNPPVRFIFTSSVGVAQSWDHSLGGYPEELVKDAKYAVGSGYGEAKYVSEMILLSSGLDAVSVRIGQITGSRATGAWSTSDWVPTILQSSVALGALPTAHGNISWLSPDTVASIILQTAQYDGGSLPQAMNITHTKPITWNKMILEVQKFFSTQYTLDIPTMPIQEWFNALVKTSLSISNTTEASQITAIKLIDFIGALSRGDSAEQCAGTQPTEVFGLPVFQTDVCRSISPALAQAPPLSKDEINSWMRYWGHKDLFTQVE